MYTHELQATTGTQMLLFKSSWIVCDEISPRHKAHLLTLTRTFETKKELNMCAADLQMDNF